MSRVAQIKYKFVKLVIINYLKSITQYIQTTSIVVSLSRLVPLIPIPTFALQLILSADEIPIKGK